MAWHFFSRGEGSWRRQLRQGLTLALLAGAGLLLGLYWFYHRRLGRQTPPVKRLQLSIRESAHGFELRRSLGGRMLFRLQAATAIQLRAGQRAILRQVKIDIYQAGGERVDQFYGQQFQYMPGSGLITAPGLVHIDVGGRLGPPTAYNQPPAEERGNPIHIEANNLSFNTRTGMGESNGGVQFRYLEANGQAASAQLSSHPNQATMTGGVELHWQRPGQAPVYIHAHQAMLSRATATIMLTGRPGHPVEISQTGMAAGGAGDDSVDGAAGSAISGVRKRGTARPSAVQFAAPRMVLFLHNDYTVDKLHCLGGIRGQWTMGEKRVRLRAGSGWLWMRRELQKKKQVTGMRREAHARVLDASWKMRGGVGNTRSGGVRKIRINTGNKVRSDSNGDGNARGGSAKTTHGLLPNQPAQIERLWLRHGVRIERQLPGETGWIAARQLQASFSPGNHLRRMILLHQAKLASEQAGPNRSQVRGRVQPTSHANLKPAQTGAAGEFSLPGLPFSATGAAHGNWTLAAPRLSFDFAAGKRTGAPASLGRMPAAQLRQVTAGRAGARNTALARLTLLAPGRPPESAEGRNMRFDFGRQNRLSAAWVNGAVRLATSTKGPHGMTPRINTAQRLKLSFDAAGRLAQAKEDGQIELRQGDETASADRLLYLAAKQELRLFGVLGSAYTGGLVQVRAPQFQMASREIYAEQARGLIRTPGAVRIAMRPQSGIGFNPLPDGATGGKPAGSGTINLAAGEMQAYQRTGWAMFRHAVRLWQGPNLISARRMLFDRKQQTLDAGGEVVSAFLLPPQKAGKNTLLPAALSGGGVAQKGGVKKARSLTIQAQSLHFSELQHMARYEGRVAMVEGITRIEAHQLNIYLRAGGRSAGAGEIRRIEARGAVRLSAGKRRGKAERVGYNLSNNQITMRGGTPSIYDAELGFLTGRTLTFNPAKDSIKVESWSNARVYSTYYPKKQKP